MVLIMTFLWESLTLWFRTFSVDFNEEKIIEVKKNKTGLYSCVPQGSHLGPLLFFIFMI